MSEFASPSAEVNTTIQHDANATTILVAGSISEQSNLIVPERVGARIRLDTSGVTRINSMGVASWIRYMGKLAELGVPVSIAPLSVCFVIQAGMISNFLGTAQVENFEAPYFCPECDHTVEQLYAFDAEVPESIPCEKCQSPMQFDDEIDNYLGFRK